MNQKPKIFIGGDSWGCGEWIGHKVTHRGLEQYFLDVGYTVINSSRPSSSNIQSIIRLDESLKIFNNDIILWIQTDPIRDVSIDKSQALDVHKLRDGIEKFGGFVKFMEFLLHENYKKLNDIAKENNTVIHLIGGMTNVMENIASDFKNLNVVVQSWHHLLVGNIPQYSEWYKELYLGVLSKNINEFSLQLYEWKTKSKLVNELYTITKKCDQFQSLENIYPDRAHPSRHGHKKLFDYIINELKL
jgi:hypothetical protein